MCDKNKFNKVGVAINFINLLVILGTLFIASNNFGFSGIEAFKVILFTVVLVCLPGKFLCRKIKINLGSRYVNSILYFFIGLGILFIQYYIFGIIKLPKLIFIVTGIISVVEVLYIVTMDKPKINIKSIFNIKNSILISLVTIVFVYSMVKLQFTYPNSQLLSKISTYQDMLWHFGNVETLAGAFPAMDPRVSGITFKYHYFVDLFYAICMRGTGVSAEAQIMSVAPIIISYITVGGLYALAKELIISKRKQIIFILIALFSNMCNTFFVTGTKSVESLYTNHILNNVNSIAYALSATMIFSVIVIRFIKLKKYSKEKLMGFCICAIILIFVCTGLKGPFAAVMVVGLVAVSIISLIVKSKYSKIIAVFTSAVAIPFTIIYMLLLSNPAGGGGVELTIYDTVGRSIFGNIIRGGGPNREVLFSLLSIPAEFILVLGGFSIPFLIYVVEYLIGISKKDKTEIVKNDLIIIFLITTSIVGCGAFFLLSQSGLSQIYFMFVIIPFIQIIAFKWMDDKLKIRSNLEESNKKSVGSIIYKCIVVFSILFIIGGLINSTVDFIKGFKSTVYETKINEDKNIKPGGYYINKNEYESMLWMKENTSEDSIFISDRQSIGEGIPKEDFLQNRFFYFSAYSGRKAFLEGYSYSSISEEMLSEKLDVLSKIYDNDYNEKYDLAKNNGIDYIVVSELINPNFKIDDDRINVVYSNEDIKIYKIN